MAERRWRIWKWDDDQSGVLGEPTTPPDYLELSGMEWAEASTIEVMRVSDHATALQQVRSEVLKALEELPPFDSTEEFVDGWRALRDKARNALASLSDSSTEEEQP